MDSRVRFSLLLVACAVLLAGCGGVDRPDTAAVSGTVTYKNQPVVGAKVVFITQGGGARSASGTTDSQGRYELTTFDTGDGAVLGAHTVTITKVASTAGDTDAGMDVTKGEPSAAYGQAMERAAAGKGAAPRASAGEGGIPAKYADPKTSGLERTVTKEGPNDFDFVLED